LNGFTTRHRQGDENVFFSIRFELAMGIEIGTWLAVWKKELL
jgi:hypothetical protein